METDCPFICTNNNAEGSLIRLHVNMTSVRKVDRKRNELKREWKKSVEINQGRNARRIRKNKGRND
jgi:hypothetical protein